MIKKLFKKKSFWEKLSQKSKLGLAVIVVVLFGALAAYILTQSDSNLQSKASLTCDSNCQSTCSSITNPAQKQVCLAKCLQTCQATETASLPPICRKIGKYFTLAQNRGGLTKNQLSIVSNVLKRQGETFTSTNSKFGTTDEFASWYKGKCVPATCQPDWTKVVTKSPDSAERNRQPGTTLATYFWPNGCKGNTPTGRMCTQATVPLTAEETRLYLLWVGSGKPTINNLCTSPNPSPTL